MESEGDDIKDSFLSKCPWNIARNFHSFSHSKVQTDP
jgi:hypothetical protein